MINKLITMIKLTYKNIITILLFVLGLLLILLIIYNRLFRHRDSTDINFELNYWKLLFYSYLVLINIMTLSAIFFEVLLKLSILNKYTLIANNDAWYYRIIFRPLGKIFSLTTKSLETFYKYGIKRIPKLYTFYDYCCSLVLDNRVKFIQGLPFLMFFSQYIVVLSLTIDIFYFNRFHYFYSTLILLLIPVLIKVFVSCLKDYCIEGIDYMKEDAEIVLQDETNFTFSYIWRNKYTFNEKQFEQLRKSHIALVIILDTLKWVEYHNLNWPPALFLHGFKSFLYVICWGYLILRMFFFI